jgi:hypothetical protein
MGKGSGQLERSAILCDGVMEPKAWREEVFTRQRYPRTLHLPWSGSRTDDDKVLKSVAHFQGKEIVVTEKCDGENTTMTREYIHARSPDASDRSDTMRRSRSWVRQLHARISHEIPEGYRFCGENVYATHSIAYESLPGYFLLFAVFNERGEVLAWQDTKEWAQLLEIPTVPVLYQDVWDEGKVRECENRPSFGDVSEGYVVRLESSFQAGDFARSVAKFVRPNHVQTDQHWANSQLQVNKLNSAS